MFNFRNAKSRLKAQLLWGKNSFYRYQGITGSVFMIVQAGIWFILALIAIILFNSGCGKNADDPQFSQVVCWAYFNPTPTFHNYMPRMFVQVLMYICLVVHALWFLSCLLMLIVFGKWNNMPRIKKTASFWISMTLIIWLLDLTIFIIFFVDVSRNMHRTEPFSLAAMGGLSDNGSSGSRSGSSGGSIRTTTEAAVQERRKRRDLSKVSNQIPFIPSQEDLLKIKKLLERRKQSRFEKNNTEEPIESTTTILLNDETTPIITTVTLENYSVNNSNQYVNNRTDDEVYVKKKMYDDKYTEEENSEQTDRVKFTAPDEYLRRILPGDDVRGRAKSEDGQSGENTFIYATPPFIFLMFAIKGFILWILNLAMIIGFVYLRQEKEYIFS